jgi:predicted aspartyl protease
VIRGVVSDGTPTITLAVGGQAWPAAIDTGFNGDLELPATMRPLFNATFLGQDLAYLAGGQSIVEDTYLLDFPFDGEVLEVEALFAPGTEILIGTNLLRRHRIEIDFAAGTVLVERAG